MNNGKLIHRIFIGVTPYVPPLPDPDNDIWLYEDEQPAISEDNQYLKLE